MSFYTDNSNRIKSKRIIKSFREVTQPILWEVHINPLVKTHSILREKSTILGEVVYYSLGKKHSILGEKNKSILW